MPVEVRIPRNQQNLENVSRPLTTEFTGSYSIERGGQSPSGVEDEDGSHREEGKTQGYSGEQTLH